MPTSQSKSALRQHRRLHGLCIHCGAVAIANQTRCRRCVDKDRENRKRYAERDAKRGVCCNTGCSKLVAPGNRYCPDCNSSSAARTARRRQQRVLEGWCSACGKKPKLPDLTRCEECHRVLLTRNKTLREKRIAEGKCSTCGVHVLRDGYKKCDPCIRVGSERHATLKLEILAAYGGPVCVGCGESEVAVLQIDHTNGGGRKHADEIGGRGKMYAWLKNNGFPDGFRVLCANCNVRAARGLPFPHQRPRT